MAYSLEEFSELRKRLKSSLQDQSGEPLSCRLYEANGATGSLSLIDGDGDVVDFHIAEACNIADRITTIERILSLPRSNIACSELSEIFLLSLDVLREYIKAASNSDSYQETEADKIIGRWAGFIKHPCKYVFAHRCLSDIYVDPEPQSSTITSGFLKNWDNLSNRQKDAKKADLAHRIVAVELPNLDEISNFFDSCAAHLQVLINIDIKST